MFWLFSSSGYQPPRYDLCKTCYFWWTILKFFTVSFNVEKSYAFKHACMFLQTNSACKANQMAQIRPKQAQCDENVVNDTSCWLFQRHIWWCAGSFRCQVISRHDMTNVRMAGSCCFLGTHLKFFITSYNIEKSYQFKYTFMFIQTISVGKANQIAQIRSVYRMVSPGWFAFQGVLGVGVY